MDLGFAGSTAVVTGGSKGMGLAIAETLAAEGASVAVMARGQGSPRRRGRSRCVRPALRTPWESAWIWLMPSPSPMASPLSPSVGANSIAWSTRSGRATAISRRWTTQQWDAAFALGTMSAVRSIRAALPLLRSAEWARIVTLVRALDPATEPAHRRLHGSPRQRWPASPRIFRKALPRKAFWSTACVPEPS